jgi:REP element-mobilizing transposase RayT
MDFQTPQSTGVPPAESESSRGSAKQFDPAAPEHSSPVSPQQLDPAVFEPSTASTRQLGLRLFAGRHHARYIEADVPVHVICRVFQGRYMLTPTPELNELIVGVLGRGLSLYGSIQLYAIAVLSNHMHLMLSGTPDHVSGFMGFVKREISRRWGTQPDVNWPGAMWEESRMTALPTAPSQQRCLEYILAHGVKEHLVEHPQQWPGIHCAKSLLTGKPLRGRWLDATSFGRAVRAEARKLPSNRRQVNRCDYEHAQQVILSPIPAWRCLDTAERQERIRSMVATIVERAKDSRGKKPVLGAVGVQRIPRSHRQEIPPPPWFEERRRMICWAHPRAEETLAYMQRYWQFQHAFRQASFLLRSGQVNVVFPPGAFRPLTYTPLIRQRE